MTNSKLQINKRTIKNRKYLNLCRKTIYQIVYTLCKTLSYQEAIEITANYYNVKKKVIKKFLKFTIFDQDIVCILTNKTGNEFITHCKFLYILYKTINKIIYKLYHQYDDIKNVDLIDCIQSVGDWLSEYEPEGNKIVFNAIKIELRKNKSKYKNFYRENLDKKFIEQFELVHFHDKVENIFNKLDKIKNNI